MNGPTTQMDFYSLAILGEWKQVSGEGEERRNEVVLAQLHMSHTCLLTGEWVSCTVCLAALMVRHILAKCAHLVPVKHRCCKERNIGELF